MENIGTNFTSKDVKQFSCYLCDFYCCKKGDWNRHISTLKHQNTQNGKHLEKMENIKNIKLNDQTLGNEKSITNFYCDYCKIYYKTASGLWKHKQKCDINKQNNTLTTSSETQIKLTDLVDKDEIILMLIKQTSELIKEQTDIKQLMIGQQNMILEIAKNGTNLMSNSNNINSHNKTFNLQFFLNETCKDAMNISEFIDNIKIDVSDLENMGRVGYVEGMSNILIKNLNVLDVTKRPIHCTDKKRETMYIKDNNVWEKDDEENNKFHKTIKRVSHKSIRVLPAYRQKYPGCEFAISKFSDRYNKMIIEVMGGPGDNDTEKEDKIIQKVAKYITINKGSSDL